MKTAFLKVILLITLSPGLLIFHFSEPQPALSKSQEAEMSLTELAQSMQDYVVSLRRELHRHPETRWEEEWTLKRVKTEVRRILDPSPLLHHMRIYETEGGLWVDIDFDPDFDRLLYRADVDALPVTENTGLPFASQVKGKMHACGHDVHSAMLLGGLAAISRLHVQHPDTIRHNLRLVFQRAEENPGSDPRPESGGKVLVDEGVTDGVSSAHALHIWAPGEAGIFESRPGAFLGNSDRLQMKIRASGGHVARPQDGINALRVIAAIQEALNGFPNRYFGPLEPWTLEPVILRSGTGSNIMPAEAELWYGVRTMVRPEERDEYFEALKNEVLKVLHRFPGAELAHWNKIIGHPAMIINESEYRRTKTLLESAGQAIVLADPLLGGEDFAHYLYKVPGTMWMLGAKTEGTGGHHAPTFNPDESVFWRGVLFWLLLAVDTPQDEYPDYLRMPGD